MFYAELNNISPIKQRPALHSGRKPGRPASPLHATIVSVTDYLDHLIYFLRISLCKLICTYIPRAVERFAGGQTLSVVLVYNTTACIPMTFKLGYKYSHVLSVTIPVNNVYINHKSISFLFEQLIELSCQS